MELISQAEFAESVGLQWGEDGLPTEACLARAIRRAVERWHIAPKSRVMGHVKTLLRAAGRDDEEARALAAATYERLSLVGGVEPVQLAGRPHCARAAPRWIRLAADLGVVTGTHGDLDVQRAPALDGAAAERTFSLRFDPTDLEALATLQGHDITEWSLSEWRGELGYVKHLLRRRPSVEAASLEDLWQALVSAMASDGGQVSEDVELRAVTGSPGDYFGSGTGPRLEGRWTNDPPEGLWCGLRKGYSEKHWRRTLVEVSGDRRRVFDLYDDDEWCWALLARGLHLGAPEVAERQGDSVTFTYPLPRDLERLMSLLSEGRQGWTWVVDERIPDHWSVG